MTDEEINALIVREENRARWHFYKMDWNLLYLFNPRKGLAPFERTKAFRIWTRLGEKALLGHFSETTRQFGFSVAQIYALDQAGDTLPVRQAVRLFDTHRRQQKRLAQVSARMEELRALSEQLETKLARLHELGESYASGTRTLEEITADHEALTQISRRIQSSCTRLEMLVIAVQKAVQARQLRRELDELSARLPHSGESVEPAFEPESLETIERQIGREIETYLHLERETEEHLR